MRRYEYPLHACIFVCRVVSEEHRVPGKTPSEIKSHMNTHAHSIHKHRTFRQIPLRHTLTEYSHSSNNTHSTHEPQFIRQQHFTQTHRRRSDDESNGCVIRSELGVFSCFGMFTNNWAGTAMHFTTVPRKAGKKWNTGDQLHTVSVYVCVMVHIPAVLSSATMWSTAPPSTTLALRRFLTGFRLSKISAKPTEI